MATTPIDVSGNYTPASPFKPRVVTPEKAFSMESFMKILGTQMKSQNPMEPMKDNDFIAQMTQFTSLEKISEMTTTMQSMALSSQLSQGSALIGRTVTYAPANGSVPVTGVVDRVTVQNGKGISLMIGGVPVSPSAITEVRAS